MDEKLRKALLWFYIAQHVRGMDKNGNLEGVKEEDCKKYYPHVYESLLNNEGYIAENPNRKYSHLIVTTAEGTKIAQALIKKRLSNCQSKIEGICSKIPPRLLAFFVKQLFSSHDTLHNDGLHMEEGSSWTWNEWNDRKSGDLAWNGHEDSFACLLNFPEIKSKRDGLLENLVQLGLAVKDIETFRFADQKSRGDVYVIAPEVMDFLKENIREHFDDVLFNDILEKRHKLFHIFSDLLHKTSSERKQLFESEGLLDLQEIFEARCKSLLQQKDTAIKQLEHGTYKDMSNEYNWDSKYANKKQRHYTEAINRERLLILEPLVEYLCTEIIKCPEPESIASDLIYFQNNTREIFFNFLSSAESSIDICSDTTEAEALDMLLCHLKGKDVLKKTRIIARSLLSKENVKKIIGFGIPKENIAQCKRLHAKLIIRDNEVLLVSSCNITSGALGERKRKYRSGSYEATIITEDANSMKNAMVLFEGIFNEQREIQQTDSPFISSCCGIPSKIEELIKNAQREIVIAVPPLFGKIQNKKEKSIFEYINELKKPEVSLMIYANDTLPKDSWDYYEMKIRDKFKIKFVKELLHAKVYIFDDEVALISSLNPSYQSWTENIEAGYLTTEKEQIEKIKKRLSEFTKVKAKKKKNKGGDGGRAPMLKDIRRIEAKFEPEGRIILRDVLRLAKPQRRRSKKIKIYKDRKKKTEIASGKDTLLPCQEKLSCVISCKGYFRCGRGFSYSELTEAGLSITEAKKLPVQIDIRRRTCHKINTERLLKSQLEAQ